MDDTYDTSSDTGPTSDANTNYTSDGSPSTSTGTFGGWLQTAAGLGGSVLNYLGSTNAASAQKTAAQYNAAASANNAKIAGLAQKTWLYIGAGLAAVIVLVVILRRK